MRRVTGIGGVFFKANDPEKLYQWYEKHLGIKRDADGSGVSLKWSDEQDGGRSGMTIWSIFPRNSKYFDPSQAGFMINYRVENMGELLQALEAEGIEILGRQDEVYGRFAWIMDPEGNRIELWEPPKAGG
jgi:predicted enzyme related to lactoylglutathione lyase